MALSASAPRAQIVTSTPSRASASAQPLPSPFEAAHTIADLPLMPRSMDSLLAGSLNALLRKMPARSRVIKPKQHRSGQLVRSSRSTR